MRMLDSYYSGDINKDEMTALKDKYDKEIEENQCYFAEATEQPNRYTGEDRTI